MKKIILMSCAVMISSFLVFATSSFASRGWRTDYPGRAGHYKKWQTPPVYKHGRAWNPHLRQYRHRPTPGFMHKHPRWHRGPVYRHGHPGRLHPTVVREINNYYGSAEDYREAGDQFSFSTSVSDTGFSFSVGVEKTD